MPLARGRVEDHLVAGLEPGLHLCGQAVRHADRHGAPDGLAVLENLRGVSVRLRGVRDGAERGHGDDRHVLGLGHHEEDLRAHLRQQVVVGVRDVEERIVENDVVDHLGRGKDLAQLPVAAAVGLAAGVPFADVAAGLPEVRLASARRMDVFDRGDGVTVIDDSYNANPASMAAALRALVAIGTGRRTVAVLGYMAELGDQEQAGHEEVGRLAAELGVDPEEAAHVKGLEIPMHDPRAYQGAALTYAVGPRGACHLKGGYYNLDAPGTEVGLDVGITFTDKNDPDQKGALSAKVLSFCEIYNSLTLCQFSPLPASMIAASQ